MTLSPAQVEQWLADLKENGIANTAKEAAVALDVSQNSMSTMRRKGVTGDASRRTALAMAAILARIDPYGRET